MCLFNIAIALIVTCVRLMFFVAAIIFICMLLVPMSLGDVFALTFAFIAAGLRVIATFIFVFTFFVMLELFLLMNFV